MTETWAVWMAGAGLLLIIGAYGFTWKVRQDYSRTLARAHDKADGVSKDLADYKLQAADRFAQIGHLRDVEGRLADSIRHLEKSVTEQLSGLREDLRAVLQGNHAQCAPSRPPGRRGE